MTAKEKANELFNKIYNSEDYDGYCNGCGLVFEQAKDIAVIAVDEILKTFDCTTPQSIEYWQEVKKEIQIQ
jgi:hypothetical protein